jgi:REP element-mobilizing transposase RayT
MPHRRRAPHDPRCPVHVTLRATSGLPSLRSSETFLSLQRAFGAASRYSFRVLQFSVQSNHLHLLVEADTPTRLARGVQGLAVRAAKAINRALRRHGGVWAERYHAHALKTPREVRNALVYVLNNILSMCRAPEASTRAPRRHGSPDGGPAAATGSADPRWRRRERGSRPSVGEGEA